MNTVKSRLAADLHLHSPYSRATSRAMDPPGLERSARIKGLGLIGTADFTHPGWFRILRESLEPSEDGLYRLKPELCLGEGAPPSCGEPETAVRFLPTAEISNIYKKNGSTRKVHSIILAPTLEAAEKLSHRLGETGNIKSDGRPIIGMDARRLLEMVLESDPRSMLIPAHVWTPHFSVFGAASGFDSLEECFEDLTPEITAIESGLSSDPAMNRLLSALDHLSIVSNSDAHSPSNLGREATLFDCERSSEAIFGALRKGPGGDIHGTIEFYPEEGKYHADGHRACDLRLSPEETRAHGGRCPVCGGKITIGVLNRVTALADRREPGPVLEHSYHAVPLKEQLGELLKRGVNTKTVDRAYSGLIERLGPELSILLDVPLEEIELAGGPRGLAEAIGRMRSGEVSVSAGYDGVYGRISVSG